MKFERSVGARMSDPCLWISLIQPDLPAPRAMKSFYPFVTLGSQKNGTGNRFWNSKS